MIADVATAYAEAVFTYYLAWITKWPEKKRRQIYESVRLQSVAPDYVGAFVKNEVNHKVPTKGRLIHPYLTMSTQEFMARELTCFQKALAILDDYEYSPGIYLTAGSGRTARYLAEWAMRVAWVSLWYEQDGVTWDARLGLEHHKAKMRFLRACDPQMAAFVESCYKTKAMVRDRKGEPMFQYCLDGTVRSGHNDTTSGNTLINLLVAGVMLKRAHLRGRAIAAGDDLLVQIDASSLAGRSPNQVAEQLRVLVAEYGIKPESRIFSDLSSATFISARWLEVGGSLRFVPLMGRLVSRLWWTVQRVPPRLIEAYKRGVCLAVRAVTGELPIAHGLTQSHANPGEVYYPSKNGWLHYGEQEVPRRAGAALAATYGMTTTEIMEMDVMLSSLGVSRVSHPGLDRLREHDFAEIGSRPCAIDLVDLDEPIS
jgi:hypothetical protein